MISIAPPRSSKSWDWIHDKYRRPIHRFMNIIIGAGPAGLTAAYALATAGHRARIIERETEPGGLARTIWHNGYGFDIGGHRFYTKSPEIQTIWREVLGADFHSVQRLSRIYYDGKFFDYPLRPWNALAGLGPAASAAIVASYIRRKLAPLPCEHNFEQFITNRFGDRLYRTFFKTYTEKVWGMPCAEIQSDWAAQRIQDLSLASAIGNAFFKRSATSSRSLIDQFDYPRLGPGMLWQRMADRISDAGSRIDYQQQVTAIQHDGHGTVTRVLHQPLLFANTCSAVPQPTEAPVHELFSSMPLQALIQALQPHPPESVLAAARALRYRDFLTVNLCMQGENPFPDQWIYIHSPQVRVGRIQNFRNWSRDLVPTPNSIGIGMEYFCTAGDDLWTMPDDQLCGLATDELRRLGLSGNLQLADAFVMRVKKAYPVYDADFASNINTIKAWLTTVKNLHTIGRNGLHRYNNQDHSMLTALRAVDNVLRGTNNDLWQINADTEYGEKPG